MPFIPVDTAVQLIVGPLIDDTDFKSLELGVAYNAAGMAVDLIKSSISGTPTKTDLTLTTGGTQDWIELGNGMYYIEVTAAQNNVEGELQLVGLATGILPFISPKYQVVPALVYNSLVAGSDNLQVDTIQVGGTSQTANDNGADINAILVDTADMQPRVAAIEVDTSTTLQGELDAIQAAVITNAAGVDIAADIIAIKAETAGIITDTTEIGVAGAGLTNLGASGNNWNVGKTGYTLTQSFPANFSALGISVGGDIDNVTLTATCTTNTDMRGTDGANTTTPPTAAAIVNEWESQSQLDPTGFHVNVMEVNSVAEDIATETKQDVIDANIDAVKVKTDQMTYTNANELDANTKSINDAEVIGDGSGTPWDGV